MTAKRVLILLVLLAPLPLLLAPKPSVTDRTEPGLFASRPLLLRAVSNISHALAADFLWLASGRSGEITRGDEEVRAIYNMGEHIVTLDPYFFPAVNYFATYLGSLHGEVEASSRLYKTARMWDSGNVMLYVYEIVLRTTYQKPLDSEAIVRLSKEAYSVSEANGYMKKTELQSMLEGFVIYARSKQQKRQKMRDDLLWLREKTQNEKRRERIDLLLESL